MLFAFDFDGVVLDSLDHNIETMNRAAEWVGLPRVFLRDAVMACDTMSWEFVAERCGIPSAAFLPFSEKLFELLLEEPPETRLFDGMVEVLWTARELGRTAVVTSNFESLAKKVLAVNGVGDAVEDFFGAETSNCKTEKLRLAAERFGVPLAQTVKIGDCISDITHAHEAGIRSVGVTWGFHSAEQLASASPEALVSSPQELASLLRQWSA